MRGVAPMPSFASFRSPLSPAGRSGSTQRAVSMTPYSAARTSFLTQPVKCGTARPRERLLGRRRLTDLRTAARRCLLDGQAAVHAALVVTGQVADEDVVPRLQPDRPLLRLAGRHVLDLEDVLAGHRLLVHPAALEDRKSTRLNSSH